MPFPLERVKLSWSAAVGQKAEECLLMLLSTVAITIYIGIITFVLMGTFRVFALTLLR